MSYDFIDYGLDEEWGIPYIPLTEALVFIRCCLEEVIRASCWGKKLDDNEVDDILRAYGESVEFPIGAFPVGNEIDLVTALEGHLQDWGAEHMNWIGIWYPNGKLMQGGRAVRDKVELAALERANRVMA